MKRQVLPLIGFTGVVSFLLGLVAAGSRIDGSRSMQAPSAASDSQPLTVSVAPAGPSGATAPAAGLDFAAVVARLNAAVVNVDAASRGGGTPAPFRFPPDAGGNDSGPREGSGSGFIIDPAGYILTNYHVVEGADRVTITLGDGRSFRAAVLGVDPAIDVALLHIATPDKLPVAPLGDSEKLRVGEWVCAIGNPLGYVHSVTVGVVSFLGRKIWDQSLDALIQTDAAISFGNSGGPLINGRGQVVGITTAISAQAANIGFAVPIDQAIAVLPQLKERGRVSRGFIGIGLTNLTAQLQRALNLAPAHGALVQEVTPESPAERAGLRAYDVITGADGRAIQSDDELIRYISGRRPGLIARLDVWRDGSTREVPVKLEERPLAPAARLHGGTPQGVRPAAAHDDGPLGFSVRDLDATTARRLQVPDAVTGVLIVDVDPAGPARLARIRGNQILLEINRRRVATAADYRTVVAGLTPGEPVALYVYDPALDQHTLYSVVLDPRS